MLNQDFNNFIFLLVMFITFAVSTTTVWSEVRCSGDYSIEYNQDRIYLYYESSASIDFSSILNNSHCESVIHEAEIEPVVFVENIKFNENSSALSVSNTVKLNKLLLDIEPLANKHIDIFGHTDSQGSITLNKLISDKRAESVAEYLTNSGVKANSINEYGLGGKNPVATNKTPEGRRLNHRVDIIVKGIDINDTTFN